MIKKYLAKVFPYLLIGIIIVFSIVAFIIFSWLLIWGAIVGAFLYLFFWVKAKLLNRKVAKNVDVDKKERIGNVYDHDEINK